MEIEIKYTEAEVKRLLMDDFIKRCPELKADELEAEISWSAFVVRTVEKKETPAVVEVAKTESSAEAM